MSSVESEKSAESVHFVAVQLELLTKITCPNMYTNFLPLELFPVHTLTRAAAATSAFFLRSLGRSPVFVHQLNCPYHWLLLYPTAWLCSRSTAQQLYTVCPECCTHQFGNDRTFAVHIFRNKYSCCRCRSARRLSRFAAERSSEQQQQQQRMRNNNVARARAHSHTVALCSRRLHRRKSHIKLETVQP